MKSGKTRLSLALSMGLLLSAFYGCADWWAYNNMFGLGGRQKLVVIPSQSSVKNLNVIWTGAVCSKRKLRT
jgi:hypothetical protein